MESSEERTRSAIEAFNAAFNGHDIETVMSQMTADCVFENTFPAPDGTRYSGASEVRKAFEEFFAESANAHFGEEETIIAGDRAVIRWRYDWGSGHVRGVDVMKVRDGKVSEKFSYVKG